MDCIFCKIIKGEIQAKVIYEDDIVISFLDIFPDSNGHCLIIPKVHTLDIVTIDDEVLLHIFKVAKKIKHTLECKLNCDGLTFIQNNGDIQEVKHFHLHLKPYYKDKQDIKNVDEIYNLITK